MRRTTILNAKEIKRTPLKEAQSAFYKHCRLKNLTEQTLKYYEENLSYFRSKISVKYADEITQEVFEAFLLQELDAGKKVTSLNSRIRGLRVFFNFCTEREYMKPISVKLMKEEETIKETYTDAELRRLLKRPESNSWVEWRTWAAVNYLVATGNRASTVINIKISDVDFDEMTIRLVKVKNRRQQLIPLSPALKEILMDYLKTWEHTPDDYLFPSYEGNQLNLRSFQGSIRRYNISRGVTKTSVHLFRHTFAKNFILAGGGMVQLQALLGHSTMDMTRHYVNIYGTDLKRNFELLNPLDNIKRSVSAGV